MKNFKNFKLFFALVIGSYLLPLASHYGMAHSSETSVIDAIVGYYENHQYDNGGKNNWHYVKITKINNLVLRWKNSAGASWTLSLSNDPTKLNVGKDCPYYDRGHKQATVLWSGSKVVGLLGPWGEKYDKQETWSRVWKKWDWSKSPELSKDVKLAIFDGNGFLGSNTKRSAINSTAKLTKDQMWSLFDVSKLQGNIFGTDVFYGYKFKVKNLGTGTSIYTGDSVDGGGGTLIPLSYDAMNGSRKSRSSLFVRFKTFAYSTQGFPNATSQPWGKYVDGRWVGLLMTNNPGTVYFGSVSGYTSGKYCRTQNYGTYCQYYNPGQSFSLWYSEDIDPLK